MNCEQRCAHIGMCGRLRVPAGQFSMLRLDPAVCLFPVAISPKLRRCVEEGMAGTGAQAGLLLHIEKISRLGTLSASAGIASLSWHVISFAGL